MLELNLYHKFSKSCPGFVSQDQAMTGLSIWSGAWEEILKPPKSPGSPRDLGADWNGLFRPRTGSVRDADGVITFLKLVQQVSHLWDKVSDQKCSTSTDALSAEGLNPPQKHKESHSMLRTTKSQQTSSAVDMLCEKTASKCVAVVPDNQDEEDLISLY